MKIDIQQFGGRRPIVSPRLLEEHMSQAAINCEFDNGKLVAVKSTTQVTDHSTAVPKTLWKMGEDMIIFPDGEENTVIDSPVDETNNRIFWTDGVLPKQSDDTLWGETTWWRRLGVKPPAVAPTITVSGVAGDDVQDYVSYVFTMVTTWGEESAPGPATAVGTIMSDQYVDLSVMTTPSDSYNTYEYKRIYRLSSGTQGAEYQYLAQIAVAETTYQDKATGNALDEVETDIIETTDWALPPATLKGLAEAHNGMFIGYDGKELYISEPNYAYAWPTDYIRTFDTDIQGIGAANQYIVVVTKKYCYVLTGSHPLAMVKSKLGNPQGCLHDRGLVSSEFGILYPSPDGLCLCDGRKVTTLSKKWISKTDWLALNPETLVSEWHDNKYYGFFQGTNDGIVYDIETGEFSTVEFGTPLDKIYDAYVDLETDTLSILCTNTAGTNGYTYTYASAATYMDYTWTSKIFVDNESYNCGMITGPETLGSELIAATNDRTFAGASNWTNGDINAYNETGDLTITADAAGQYCTLPDANAVLTIGKLYRLTFDVANLVSEWSIQDEDADQVLQSFVREGTNTIYFTYSGSSGGGLRIVSSSGTSSADFDNFSIKELPFEVVLQYYEDGTLTLTKTVKSNTGIFRLPPTGYTQEKYFTLTGSYEIYRVQIATSPGEIN